MGEAGIPSGKLTRDLKRRARAAGFDLVGVAAADRLGRDAAALEDWLRGGLHAGMAWLAASPELRCDPRRILPGCRSVVSLAVNYHRPDRASAVAGRGRVARYARGRDYHRVLGKQAKALARWLEETSGKRALAFVDTGPVLERAWAARAGIGWIGKNANLISRKLGSWLLLAEILAVARLEPDPGPHADFCGTCNACIEACPTGAITAPGVVDARRCISYWTIEHRGPVPEGACEGNGDRIFGCDACQEVCPWNTAFAQSSDGPLVHRPDLESLNPAEILCMDEATFRARYSGTPIMRARWDGMRRNACIVLGNLDGRSAVLALTGVLRDADPLVREHARRALHRIEKDGSSEE